MKKYFLIILLSPVVLIFQGIAQTNTFPSSGNAGVGTTNPGTTALVIQRSNSDGGATDVPAVSILNTNSTNPNGSGYNQAWAHFSAGNGSMIGQFVANYGVGASAPWSGGTGFYITTRNDQPLIFATGATTTEKMRITHGGNVGIGTTNPNYVLDVVGTGTAHGQSMVRFTNPTSYNLQLALNASGSGNTNFGFTVNDQTKGAVGWNQSDNSLFFWNAVANSTNVSFKVLSSGDVAMYNVSNGNENVRFTSGGNVGIGSSPSEKLEVNGNIKATGFILPTSAASGKVLTSDASGNGSWQTPSAVGWAFNGSTVSSLKTFGTANNYDLPIITNNTERMRVLANGNVGIGTSSPQALLDLGPGNGVKMLFYGSGGNSGYYWGTGVNLGQSSNEASIFIGGASGTCCGAENFAIVSADQSTWPYSSYTTRFVVNSRTGNVGIGTITPQAKLAVNGDVFAKKVKVTQSGWPDYVFHTSYRLRPISEVEQYIKLYHHLPEVPSAAAVEKDGIDLGDNQATLLKKIEELTLYIISLNKEVEALKREIRR